MVDHRMFWGKARPAPGSALPFHPVAWHGLDVAAVFLEVLDLWPDEAAALARCFDGPWDVAKRALAVLVACHDIGKFAPAFQFKVPELVPEALRPCVEGQSIDHGFAGMIYFAKAGFLESAAAALLDAAGPCAELALLQPVFGHHGKPVSGGIPPSGVLRRDGGASAQAARSFFGETFELLQCPALPEILESSAGARLFWPMPAPAPATRRCWPCCRSSIARCASSVCAAACR